LEKGYALIMNDRDVGNSERPSGARCASGSGVDDRDGAFAPKPPLTADPERDSDACERRSTPRVDVLWSVDCETEDTFLYAAITNISEMGIFVATTEPLAVGTSVTLRFAPPGGGEPFILDGVVQWVNRIRPREHSPNPGMGIRFARLTLADRERIVDSIRTIAYLREEPRSRSQPPESSRN
jgi:type IV pilus assembly protein PilZ